MIPLICRTSMRIHALTYVLAFISVAPSDLCAQSQPVAVQGVLDLSEYDFKRRGPVELEGEFEFYWNQRLNPAPDQDSGEMIYTRVPGSWHRLKKVHPGVERYGFATYRLTILLPSQVDAIGFCMMDIFSSSSYFINGKALDYLGFPGVNKYQTVIRHNRPLVTTSVPSTELELLIHVSNFDYRLSGIVGGITMGTAEQMTTARQKDMFRGHFLMGAFLIIGIYFLGLSLIRWEKFRFYFALICILMAARVVMILDLPVLETLNLNGPVLVRIDYLNIYLFAPLFSLMIHSLFPYEFPRLVLRVILWISAVFILTVLVTPVSLFSNTLFGFFLLFILISMVFLVVIIRAWYRGRSHAPAFAIGLVILFLGTLNDMLNEIDVIQTTYMVQYTMFVFLLIYAYIFADKSHTIQRNAEKLAGELDTVRNNLENLVEERTEEIQTMSRQLERQKKKLETTNRDLLEAINARNRLFAIIGHDVRAPIGYTRQALEMILENPDMSEEERSELMRMMASSAAVTYNLLDNLLVWGRSQTGKLKATPVRFKLKSLIDESLELVNIGVKDKKLKVEVYVSEEHFVYADRDQLYIVIRNLLSNAMKFTPEGGSIYISSKKQKGLVVVSIRDTGIGIPSPIIRKLLDAESHVSTKGTRGEKGSGLGLKICNEILLTNKGWMKIDGESGGGTTIQIGIRAAKKQI